MSKFKGGDRVWIAATIRDDGAGVMSAVIDGASIGFSLSFLRKVVIIRRDGEMDRGESEGGR